jgi:hypothetical protein
VWVGVVICPAIATADMKTATERTNAGAFDVRG